MQLRMMQANEHDTVPQMAIIAVQAVQKGMCRVHGQAHAQAHQQDVCHRCCSQRQAGADRVPPQQKLLDCRHKGTSRVDARHCCRWQVPRVANPTTLNLTD
jgi:hypothetical protein